MGFWLKLFGRAEVVPGWASCLDEDSYRAFHSAVMQELARRQIPNDLDEAEGIIHVRSGNQSQTLGLLNLAQQCAQIGRAEWAGVIRRHFEILLVDTLRSAEILEELGENFEAARSLLKVRLQPLDFGTGLEATVSQPVADDLISLLVYDLPESIATVHPHHVEQWGVPEHDLFQLGLRNVLGDGPLEASRIDLGNGAWLDHYEDPENYFGAAHALLLHAYFDSPPELGMLVSVPHRHGMVVHAIDTRQGLESALPAMMYFTPRLFQQGPGSITPSVYWYRYGNFTRIPYEMGKDDAVSISPPVSFSEQVLAPLQRSDAG